MINSPLSTRAGSLARHLVGAVLAAIFALSAAPLAQATQQTYLKVSDRALGVTQQISLEVDKSMIVDLPTDVGEVVVSQPTVATAVMRSKTRAIVQGIAGGDTNIIFLDGAGNNISRRKVFPCIIAFHKGVAIDVPKDASVAANCFCNQESLASFAKLIQCSGMKLNELHVFNSSFCSINHRNSIACSNGRVGGGAIYLPVTACSE